MAATYDFSEARYRCVRYSPYTYASVCNLIPIPKPGLGTLGVDKWMRVYYDPDLFEKWTIDEFTTTILHEVYHVLLNHHSRFAEILGEKPTCRDQLIANIAGDICINDILRDTRRVVQGQEYSPKLPKGALHHECVEITPFMVAPPYCFPITLLGKVFSFDEGLDAVSYYYELKKIIDDAPEPPEGGGGESTEGDEESDGDDESTDGGNGKPTDKPYKGKRKPKPCMGGESGACDGQKKPWEEKSPDEGGPEGLSDFKKRLIERKVAQDTEDYQSSQGRGSVPGGFARVCKDILQPPINVFATLRSMVSSCTTMSPGGGDYTWRKIPRRQIGVRLPASYRPTPKGVVFVDTSGSMDNDDLAKGLGVIAQGLANLPKGNITVMTGDTQTDFCKTVFRIEDVELQGGGGTDMAYCLKEACEHKSKPDFVIVVTDGETGWPTERPEGPRKIIVVLTRPESKYYTVPDFCQTICIADGRDE